MDMLKVGDTMTDQQIIDWFDYSNITIADLARMSGRTVQEIKALLMEWYDNA